MVRIITNRKFLLFFSILSLIVLIFLTSFINFNEINSTQNKLENQYTDAIPIQEELSLGISSPLTPKNAYAIVVGISDYPGSDSDLSYCDDDALDVYQRVIR